MKPTNSVEPVTVALPLGIGDAHWSCQKLRALKKLHGNAPLHAFINESEHHQTVNYLHLLPFIDKAVCDKAAPYSITTELPGTYKDPRYQSLDGCRNWRGFDYVLVANHAMESGISIADWVPELGTDYRFTYRYTKAQVAKSLKLMPEPEVLLYLSGLGPNRGFHENTWTVQHWRGVVERLNQAGVVPTLVGANTVDDLRYCALVERELLRSPAMQFRNIVGKTSLAVYVHIIERARAWCGLNSGGGIVSASAGTPTVMMWADSRWPVGMAHFRPGMQTAWLSSKHLSTYRTFSYGSPAATPENVARAILAVAR